MYRLLEAIRRRANRLLVALGLQSLSLPAKILAVLVIAAGAAFTVVVLVLDFLSGDPSSTAPAIVLFMALYVFLALGVIWFADRGVRRLLKK